VRALITHRNFATEEKGIRKRPGWCLIHDDLGWRYSDGFTECLSPRLPGVPYRACEVVTGVLSLPRGTIRKRTKT
jgi:hypothetical protein